MESKALRFRIYDKYLYAKKLKMSSFFFYANQKFNYLPIFSIKIKPIK